MLPESLRRLAFSVAGAMVLALVTTTSALAQGSAGKIQGRVVDAQSGEPIAAAQVEVVGTNRGNITNDEGYYFINDVPPGLMDIRAEGLGYGAVVVNDQRVLAGHAALADLVHHPGEDTGAGALVGDDDRGIVGPLDVQAFDHSPDLTQIHLLPVHPDLAVLADCDQYIT